MLNSQLKERLLKAHEALLAQGALLTPEQLNESYSLFRRRFGPNILKNVQGQELLKLMHARGSKDSLVYWLEFKKDAEFPARFGSISGGNALKFGLYWRDKTGEWLTGNAQRPTRLSRAEAAAVAEKQRDQLIAAEKLMQKFPENASDSDYRELQNQMDGVAPDVSDYAWGHKYLSLLHPTKLDDYHNPDYQRFHLIKLLQTPPEQPGLYVAAGRFVQIAAELDMPINHLTTILNNRDGKPHTYWRIGTSLGEGESIWPLMRDNSLVAIGWAELGDLSQVPEDNLKDTLKSRFEETYDKPANVASRKAREVADFLKRLSEGDLVLAADGARILGIGRVTGPYHFDPAHNEHAPHRRPVDWLSVADWELPEQEAFRTTFEAIEATKNLIETERQLMNSKPATAMPTQTRAASQSRTLPDGLNLILYGPPGTGKTYNTIERAVRAVEPRFIGDHAAHKARFDELRKQGQIEFITLHQSYSYEDFVEGLRPATDSEEESTEVRYRYCPGIFKRIAVQALFDCLKPASPGAVVVSFDAIWNRLVEQIEIDPERGYSGLTDKTSYRISLTPRGNLEGINVISNKTFLCPRSILEKVYAAKPKDQSISSSEVMEIVVRGCHSHFIAAVFNELKRLEKSVPAEKQPPPFASFSWDQKAEVVQAYLSGRDVGTYILKHPAEWTNYVLIADEINRGNISKVLGELITLIEPDKRLGAEHSLVVKLPYTQEYFAVPGNLHIIGTMNTADKSIALVDVALRRRFQFEELLPDFGLCSKLPQQMRSLLEDLNRRICLRKDRDHQIGHSYFMKVSDEAGFNRVFDNHVIPLLQEYFYNDWEGLRFVLGEKNKAGTFITPLDGGDGPEARTKWQWVTNKPNCLQALLTNCQSA